jgi:hypothetical protein
MPPNQKDTLPGPAETAGESHVPEFRLQFMTVDGVAYDFGLYLWTWVTTLTGGAAPFSSLLMTRNNGDLIGAPVGVFSDALPADVAVRVVERLDRIAANHLAPPPESLTAGKPFRFQMSYQHASYRIFCRFDAQDTRFLQVMSPVMQDLQYVRSRLFAKPERAVMVSVEKSGDDSRGLRFMMRLTNVGVREVMVADPRIARPGAPKPRAYINIAPVPVDVPGEMPIPPRWLPLGLEPAPQGVPDSGLIIKPKESMSILSVPWYARKAGEYVVQAIWEDYHGPDRIDPSTVQPAIPASAVPNAWPFVVRGAAFSRYLIFKV